MENKSLFPEIAEKFLPVINDGLEKKVNSKEPDEEYLYKKYLTPKFSPTFTFASAFTNNIRAKADYVAMDSPLSLRARGSAGIVSGTIPKQGHYYKLNERQLTNIQVAQAMGGTNADIAAEIYQDYKNAVLGIFDNNEFTFLQMLSTGVTSVADDNNVGALIRISAGYLDENKHTASINWGKTGFKPITDLKRVRKKAKSQKPKFAWMSDATFEQMRLSDEAKLMVAQQGKIAYTDASQLFTPSEELFKAALKAETKLDVIIIEKEVPVQDKQGNVTMHRPFVDDVVILTPTTSLGTYFYSKPARVKGEEKLAYVNEIDGHIVTKQYGQIHPVKTEFTSAEAFSISMIGNVQYLHVLETKGGLSDAQTEGDANITIEGTSYTRVSVIAALVDQEAVVSSDNTDKELLEAYNSLSSAKKTAAKAAFVAAE